MADEGGGGWMKARRLPMVLGTVLATLIIALPAMPVVAMIVRDSRPIGPDQAEARSLIEARGREVADAWRSMPSKYRRNGFVPLQDLTMPPVGIPELLYDDVLIGAYRLHTELPQLPAATGQVRFSDAEPMAVPLVAAGQAFSEINTVCAEERPVMEPGQPDRTGNVCGLPVTAAQLGEVPMQTARGPAIVPAWLFTVPGLPGPVARVAVSTEAITRLGPRVPPASSDLRTVLQPPLIVDHVYGATVHFWFDGACHEVVGAVAHETADVVVLGVQVERPRRGGACLTVVWPRQVNVTLDAPVGRRVLLGSNGVLAPYATAHQRQELLARYG